MEGYSDLRKQGIMKCQNQEPAAHMTVRVESIDPLSLHFALVGLGVLVGYLIQQFLIWSESAIFSSDFMTYIPLFPLAMIGGIIIQIIFSKVDRSHILNRPMINRIQGFALDILIVTAIGTISLDVIGSNFI